MSKHSLRRRTLALVMGVLLFFIDYFPIYALSSVQSCAKEPGLCALLGGTRPALATPGAANPFALAGGTLTNRATGAILATGGAAIALGYLTTQDMDKIRNDAIAAGSTTTCTSYSLTNNGAYAGVSGVGLNACQGILNQILLNPPQGSSFACTPDPSSCTSSAPTLSDAVNGLPDSTILAAAATAAATAAQKAAANKDVTGANLAALAAAAVNELVKDEPLVPQADKDAASSAAAAAAAAASSASDPTVAPDTPQAPATNFTKVNFLSYAVSAQGFGNKFPFGMFAPLPPGQAMTCPSFTSWGVTKEFCLIRDVISALKWIVWSNFAIYSFVNL